MRTALGLMCVVSFPAAAMDVSVRAEPSAAFTVSSPQRSYYTAGFGLFGGAQLGVTSVLDVALEAGYVFLGRAATSPLPDPGSAVWMAPGVRLHLPFATSSFAPWAELLPALVRTGDLFRPGFKAAAGALWPVGAFRLGPRVEVQQIFRLTDETHFPTADATVITAGLSVELAVLTTPVSEPPPSPPLVVAAPPPPDSDPDHDGIMGAADRCPQVAEDFDGYQDDDGCPENDNDADGVADAQDACPMIAGPAALRGCPDGDGDSVADRLDRCPTVPGLPEDGGCPRYKEVRVTETKLELLQKIFFAFGKTTIMPRSYPLLDEVVQAVKDRGSLCLNIEGHTDSVGTLTQNMALSEGRAAAVRAYLLQHGITADSLSSKGFGPLLPLENNHTPEGRERNRRVEFNIVPCATLPPAAHQHQPTTDHSSVSSR